MAPTLVVKVVGDTSALERSFARASGSSKGFEQNIGRAGRGAISASVGFRGLGRSMAFASAQFLGGAGIVFALKSTITAAEESQRVLGQTSVAVGRAGLSWAKYGKDIEAAALKLSNLSGFDDEDLLGTFAKLLRATGSVNEAFKDNALAVNVARGANISLEKATSIVLRASVGQARGLAAIGVAARKGASGVELITLLNQKFSGSAVAFGKTAEGAQERFRVAIRNTQEALGKGALPAITKYLNKASDWLSQSKNQARVQADVTQTVQILGQAVQAAAAAFKGLSDAVGGSKHAIELLVGVFAAFKAVKLLDTIAGIGGRSSISAGQVSVLRSRLVALGALGTIGVTIAVGIEVAKGAQAFSKWLGGTGFGQAVGAGDKIGSAADVRKMLQGGTSLETLQRLGNAGLLDPSGIAAVKAATAKFNKGGNLFAPLKIPPIASKPIGSRVASAGFTADPLKGLAALSPSARNQLDLTRAAGTAGTADDLKALTTEHLLLEKKIAVETARLQGATGKQAAKYADALNTLVGKNNDAVDQINAIEKKKPKGITVSQRNSFFDSAISRALDSVQDIPSITGQIATLQTIAGKITARIAKTKDVTRLLTLEAALAGVFRTIKGDQAQVAQDVTDALAFNVTKAEATAGFGDDFQTLDAALAGIRARMVKEGQTADLLHQEFDTIQAIKAKRVEAGAAFLDALSFNVDKAAVTASFADDFAANTAEQQGIKKLIAEQGVTLDLERALFKAQQDRVAIHQAIADKRQAAREAAQQAREAAAAAAKQAADAATAAAKTAADAAKQAAADAVSFKEGTIDLAKQLAQFAELKAGNNATQLAKATAQERKADLAYIKFFKERIAETQGLERQGFQKQLLSAETDLWTLDHKGIDPLTKTRAASLKKLTAGLNLDNADLKILKSNLAGAHLTSLPTGVLPKTPALLRTHVGAGGPQFERITSAAGRGAPPIHIHQTIELDGRVIQRNTTTHTQKAARRTAPQTTGRFAGDPTRFG